MDANDLADQTRALSLSEDPEKTFHISDLKSDKFPALWYRIHVLVYDLRNFATDPTARERLESVVDVTYLGQPYFNAEEVAALTRTAVGHDGETLKERIQHTLEERLNRRLKKRVESGDFRVCAAHDLAPIFEKVFDINPKKLAKDSKFRSLVSINGLRLKSEEELWNGLGNGPPKATTKFAYQPYCEMANIHPEIDQAWLLRYEEESRTEYKQVQKSWEQVVEHGLSFGSVLSALDLEPEPSKYNFYIFSNSMKAAVQLLTDRSIYVISQSSLVQLRKISGKRSLSEIFIRPPLKTSSENIDAGQMTPINALPEDDKITAIDSLNSLRNVYPTLHNNSKVLLRDMKLFGSSSECRQRLLSTQSQFCLGEPYFSASALGNILKLPVGNSTLDEALNGKICAAHDLAPCFEHAFGIDWATVRKEKNLTLQKTDEQPLKWKETKIGTLRKAFGKILPFEPEK
ncbi:conserved hypothetical protein [Histoplasma capsulatum H143]|uniref:Uncharacterized protein n=1 Tax=Ajellomyces capsulatus (strain H143) TaxID=544712 RepID=C6HQP8_AJECH|nr:conserved hypothetical protein [Histoplasma capsulatum H143]